MIMSQGICLVGGCCRVLDDSSILHSCSAHVKPAPSRTQLCLAAAHLLWTAGTAHTAPLAQSPLFRGRAPMRMPQSNKPFIDGKLGLMHWSACIIQISVYLGRRCLRTGANADAAVQ